jgi:hypothetical protein
VFVNGSFVLFSFFFFPQRVTGYATQGQLKARRRKWGRNNSSSDNIDEERRRRRAYDRTCKRRERREARRRLRREQGYSSDSGDDHDLDDPDVRADLEETRRREFVRKNWKASCYGHPAPRGWDTGTNPATDAHPDHHERLHRYRPAAEAADDHPKRGDHNHLWDTRHPLPRARLKLHRYPWNKPDLVPSGVDCKEPKTYRLHGEKYSRVINRWKARAEKVRLSLTAAGEQARLRSRRLRENPMADPEFAAAVRGHSDGVDRSDGSGGGGGRGSGRRGIDLDPGKFRRRAEARAQRSHEETLYRSFSRMQQYSPDASRRDANNPNEAFARRRARARAAGGRSSSSSDNPLPASTEHMPRGWRAPFVQSSRQRRRTTRRVRGQWGRGRAGSGLSRRDSFTSEMGEDEDDAYYPRNAKGLASGTGHPDEAIAADDRLAWERMRDDLADVIVSDGLYKLSDLRALFHETVVAAAGDDARSEAEGVGVAGVAQVAAGRPQRQPEAAEDSAETTAMTTTRKAAAQRAVAFVCNELDLPAIARLALQTPELLSPNFEGLRNARGEDGGGGSGGSGGGPSDSDGSNDRPLKITHWSASRDYAFRTQGAGRMDDDVLGM